MYKKQENSRKIFFCFIDYAKALDCVDHNKLWKIPKEITRPPDLPSTKPACKSKRNCQNWTWKNGLVQNWERSTSRLYIVTSLI